MIFNSFKRVIGTMLAICVCFSILAACASPRTTTAPASSGDGAGLDEYVLQYITTPSRYVNNDPSPVNQAIKDKFNIVIEMIAYAGDMDEKQGLMLAAGDYCEIQWMRNNSMASAYIEANALHDLEQYKDIMPNFWARYGDDQIPLWRIVGNGTLYKWDIEVPMLAETDISVNDMAMRADVLEYYGWPTPVSTSDWIELMTKAAEDFPTIDGKNAAAFTLPLGQDWGATLPFNLFSQGDKYIGAFDVKADKFIITSIAPETKESIKFFNDTYQLGLLDMESFTDDINMVEEKMRQGTVMSVYYSVWGNERYNPQIAAVAPERQFIRLPIQLDSHVASGQKRLVQIHTINPFESHGITKNAKDPERLAALVDWAMSDEGQIILRDGVEGLHWTRNASGKRELTDARIKEARDNEPGWLNSGGQDYYTFLGYFNIKMADGQWPSLFADPAVSDDLMLSARQKEAYASMGWSSSLGWYTDNAVLTYTGLLGAVSLDSTSDLGKIQQQLGEVSRKWAARLVTAKDDAEFENLWQQYFDEIMMLNPQAVYDELNRIYEELKKQLG